MGNYHKYGYEIRLCLRPGIRCAILGEIQWNRFDSVRSFRFRDFGCRCALKYRHYAKYIYTG